MALIHNRRWLLVGIAGFVLISIVMAAFSGLHDISISDLWNADDPVKLDIFWMIRLPRVVFAFLAGAGLALSGAVFQTLLRNDLATPFTLGVASGGSFGAVLAIKSGLLIQFFGFSSVSLFSVLGSLLSIMLIYFIAKRGDVFSPFSLILSGVTIGMFFAAFNLFIHYMADFTETYKMIRWIMGSLEIVGWQKTGLIAVTLILASSYFILQAGAFNIYLTGRAMALSKGVAVDRLQKSSFIIASVLVGVIVSLTGPIGFVGLIIPHMARLLIGPGHQKLFPFVILLGGAFLVWCDTLARIVIAPTELPVGIITALLGGPFFIYILIRSSARKI